MRQAFVHGQAGGIPDGLNGRQHGRPAFAGAQGGLLGLLDGRCVFRRYRLIANTALAARQPLRQRNRMGLQVAGNDFIDQPQLKRLVGLDAFAAADHLDGAGNADPARQALGAARAGNDAQRHLGQAQQRAGQRDACVAGQRQLQAAAQRRAVQRCNNRFAAGFNLSDDGRHLRVLQRLAEFPQVGAGHKGGAAADDDAGAQLRLGLQLLYRRRQTLAYRQ